MKDNLNDISDPEMVQIDIRADGTVIWVNVDGVCRLRASRIKNLVITDQRAKP